MKIKALINNKRVCSSRDPQTQTKVVKDYMKGVRLYEIASRYAISEGSIYRILKGHLGERPSTFRKNMTKTKDKLKKVQKSVLQDPQARIKELEKLLEREKKKTSKHEKEIKVVKDFLGKF